MLDGDRAPLQVVVLGVNYKRAPLVLRESLAFPAYDLESSLEAMTKYVAEGAILSTCHRVELYAATPDPGQARAQLKRFWSEQRNVPLWEFDSHLYHLEGKKAVEHLFNVACGLDSAIIGEPQILRQVRAALQHGIEHRSVGAVLGALFRQALIAGKRARTETAIDRHAASLSYAAVELARRTFGDLGSSRVLLIGAGKMGELAAKNLVDRGVSAIVVVGRTPERAQRLALRCGSAIALSRLEEALHDCDIVVTCTNAPHQVITRRMLERVMRERTGRPLFLFDLAVPRDVEPSAAELSGVRLYNVDDLEDTVTANLRERRAEARKVAPIIEEEVAAFERWFATQRVVPTIIALREHAESIRQSELARTEAVLARLSEPDRQRIEALTLAMAKKLLHRPIALLRAEATAGDGHASMQAIRHLFGLDPGEEATGATDERCDLQGGGV